jgi:hypothetical protein
MVEWARKDVRRKVPHLVVMALNGTMPHKLLRAKAHRMRSKRSTPEFEADGILDDDEYHPDQPQDDRPRKCKKPIHTSISVSSRSQKEILDGGKEPQDASEAITRSNDHQVNTELHTDPGAIVVEVHSRPHQSPSITSNRASHQRSQSTQSRIHGSKNADAGGNSRYNRQERRQ